MKEVWGVKKVFSLVVLFLLIIASFTLLTDNNGNRKKGSAVQAVRVLNKEDAKTNDIKKETTAVKEQDKAAKAKINESYGKLPLYFIANEGQVDKKVKFYEKGGGHTTFFTKEGIYLSLSRRLEAEGKMTHNSQPETRNTEPVALNSQHINLAFLNANKNPEIIAEAPQEGKVNYFIGNDPKKWRTNIPTYQAVVYKEVYKGIDMKFYGSNRQMEYDIIVKPGADPSNIKFSYEGIKELKVADNGDMEIILNTPSPLVGEGEGEGAKLIQKKPYIYQELNGKRVEVEGQFRVQSSEFGVKDSKLNTQQLNTFSYGFELASYNPDHPLIIDPILIYSTYLGGSGVDIGYGIAVDSSGNAYVTGYTASTNFPTIAGSYDTASNGSYDVFVTKLDAAGAALTYSTYLGGSGSDIGYGIAVDISGNAYVTGYTASTNFPTIAGSYDIVSNGGGDAFVTQLNATGNGLAYSTYLGGSGVDYGYGIAIDSSGNAYVTGSTASTNFPTIAGSYDIVSNGGGDAFVTKLNAAGATLTYSTYLGGSGADIGYGIAIDSSGNAYVTGYTASTNFPALSSLQNSNAGDEDAFISKLNSTGNGLTYSTYLGGSIALGTSITDSSTGIAVDSSGNAYVTGWTYSTNFPTTTGAYNTACGGCSTYSDAFVSKIGDVSGQYALSVIKAGAGSGTVTSSPTGINCGTDCYENYAASTVVTLTATPDSGSTFTGWSADCSGGSVTMSANKTCTATFFKPTLTITKAGSGTVTSSPAGISCGTDCSEAYNSGAIVTLTAAPSSGYSFSGWSGNTDCTDGSVTMNADKTCTATFTYTGGGGGCTQCQWCCKNTSTGNCESYFTDCCNGSSDEMTNKHCNKSSGGGGCGGAITDSKKDEQPPASGMVVLLMLPLLSFISWLIYKRFRGALLSNWRM